MGHINLSNILIIFLYNLHFGENNTQQYIDFIKKNVTKYNLFEALIYILNKKKINLNYTEQINDCPINTNNIYNAYYDVDIMNIMEYK